MGNQRRFTAKIEDGMEAIGTEDLEDAQVALCAGMTLLLKQQNLIKIAYREEHVWCVLTHYVSDDL